MYNEIKLYVNLCPIYQAIHTNKFRIPKIIQIIAHKPRERYVLDLQNINNNLQDKEHKYKYFFNIIEHYSKLLVAILLKIKMPRQH